jgi:predicted O-methyltransferase YrrM
MYESERQWQDVDHYFIDQLVGEDTALREAREASRAAGLPDHEVAPNQGKLLSLICQLVGARRVLEFGTLAGYSTIWLARAVGAKGHVSTMEVDENCAAVARTNFERAGVADRIRLLPGPAADSVHGLIAAGAEPFDVIFIDADKPNNPLYLAAALRLSRPGTVIIGDNVVRNGEVTDPNSSDPRVQGSRALIEAIGNDPRLSATALQTVGVKGWDGFVLAIVT